MLQIPVVYFHLCVPSCDFLASEGTPVCTPLWDIEDIQGDIQLTIRQFRHFSKIFV